MTDPRLEYQEIAPPAALDHVAVSFWEFLISGDPGAPIPHEIFPDGCASFVYCRPAGGAPSWLRVVGPRLDTFRVYVNAGDAYWGVRLKPAVLRDVFGGDASRLVGLAVMCDALRPDLASRLHEGLDAAESGDVILEVFAGTLLDLGIAPGDVDAEVAAATRIVEESGGQARVVEIAERVGLSERQLGRRFRALAGLTLKQYSRARRLRATALDLLERTSRSWAERAAERGFADQAHLSREFAGMAGATPEEFAKRLGRITHKKVVK